MKKNIQYKINSNSIELYVKPAGLLVRYFFLILAFIMVGLPISGLIYNFLNGNKFHFGFLIGLGLFSLFAFYFLRLYLWNTSGKEVIKIHDNIVEYHADYIYFNGNQQKIEFENLSFDFGSIGFEDEEKGNLIIIASESSYIQCASLIPIDQLIQLTQKLNKKFNPIVVDLYIDK